MLEILWHGRGGQGAFTAARLLGIAYVTEDEKYALAFPSFGPERRGAPIKAFTKLDDAPIGNRSQIEKADYSIFLDETLFNESAFDEIKPNGKIILNTSKEYDDKRIITVDGNKIAAEILRMPITNTIMFGAFAKVSGAISENQIIAAIRTGMPEKLQEKNIKAAIKAFEEVSDETLFKRLHTA